MSTEFESNGMERLSENDRQILRRTELRTVILGLRPASFEDWQGVIADPMSVQHALAGQGIDAIVTPHMLVNLPALERRIQEEPELAREAGWTDGMTARQLVERYRPQRDDSQTDVLRGFLAGYPASSVRGFHRRLELMKEGVPWRPEDFLDPERQRPLFATITEEADRALLVRMAEEMQGLPKRKWEAGPDRPDHADERALLDRYRPAIAELYRRYWNLSDADAEALAWTDGVDVTGPDGEYLFSFVTFGKDGARNDDVIRLQKRYAEALKKDRKTRGKR